MDCCFASVQDVVHTAFFKLASPEAGSNEKPEAADFVAGAPWNREAICRALARRQSRVIQRVFRQHARRRPATAFRANTSILVRSIAGSFLPHGTLAGSPLGGGRPP